MHDALLIVGHGSRDRDGVEEFLELGRMLMRRRVDQATALAFLEFATPTIEQSIERLVVDGARRIVCQPGMLFASGHVKNDLPRELKLAKRRWPHTEFVLAGPLDIHDKLIELCRVRWDEALRNHPPWPGQDTLLLLVGRGSSDAEANASLASIADRLRRAYRVGRSIVCYSSLASPSVSEALEASALDRFRRIVVQPYFLFTGVLVKQIHDLTAQAAARNKDKEVFSTPHLGVHPLLADVFEERANAAQAPPVDRHEAF
jgi:sirohydrochlorin ferrochelatase